MKAWLITWECAGDHAKVEKKIAAILNPRLSSKRVHEIVELIYVNEIYYLNERLAYAKNRKTNPYPAYYGTLKNVTWTGEIYCGHNPYLYARLVDDLQIEVNNGGEETLKWKERPKPK